MYICRNFCFKIFISTRGFLIFDQHRAPLIIDGEFACCRVHPGQTKRRQKVCEFSCVADSGCRIVALPRIVASRACVRTCVTRTRRVLFRGAVHLHNEKLCSSDLNMLEGSAKFRKKRCSV